MADGNSLESCCLCLSDVSKGTMKAKRVRTDGDAGKMTMDVLQALTHQFFNVKFEDIVGKASYFCKKCRTKAEGLSELVKKVHSVERELLKDIESRCEGHSRRCNQQNNVNLPAKKRRREESEELPVERQSRDEVEKEDFGVSVRIEYPSGAQNFTIGTPWRRNSVKKLARRSIHSFSSSVLTTQETSGAILKQVANSIKREFKYICSDTHDSIIRDANDGIKYFRWDRLFCELSQNTPTIVGLLLSLIPGKDDGKRVILVCVIISMLLKHRFPKMALVQRAISVLLYGNGCSKQVYNCLQPLMLTLSHAGTIKLLNRLSEDHDIAVQYWSHELLTNLKKREVSKQGTRSFCAVGGGQEGDYDLENEQPEGTDKYEDNENNEDSESDEDDENDEDAESEGNLRQSEATIVDDTELTRDMSDAVTILHEVEAAFQISDGTTDSIVQMQQDISSQNREKEVEQGSNWCSFKIVGDNFDKNFRRTYQRVDYQTESRHYFHMYAVKDRVDLNNMSDIPRDGVIDVPLLLPTSSDHELMRNNFNVLMSRMLVKHFTPLKDQGTSVVWHIDHQYSKEMAQKSIVVPLGIELKNENKMDEMCQILEGVQKYIPTIRRERSLTLPNGELYHCVEEDMWEILFGGDQLTVARARGAMDVRYTHDTKTERLQGLLPIPEDWHARMTLVKVIWTELYSSKSACDKGTLFQLKNVLNRSSVPADPKDQMQAAEDFLELVLLGHVLIAAEKEYEEGMSVEDTVNGIITNYIQLTPNSPDGSNEDDLVHSYACKLLTLGMIWHNYYDAVREGDGHRVLRIWKYLMVIFRMTDHRNYAKEAALLLINYHYSSSERVAAEILTSRFVNTKGRQGCNMPCDLHLEHLNRRLKGVLSRMESNVKPSCITRAAKALGVVDQVCRCFRDELSLQETSDIHRKPSHSKDLKIVMDILREKEIWDVIPKRRHGSISKSHSSSILGRVNEDDIHEWIIERIIPSFI